MNCLSPSHPVHPPKVIVTFRGSACQMGCPHTHTHTGISTHPYDLQRTSSGTQYVNSGCEMVWGLQAFLDVGARGTSRHFSTGGLSTGCGLWWELRQARQGEVSRRWDERTQGREEGRERSRALSFLALQGPGWGRRGVPTRDCSPALPDFSLALRASPRSDIWVFRASTYRPLAVPIKMVTGDQCLI